MHRGKWIPGDEVVVRHHDMIGVIDEVLPHGYLVLMYRKPEFEGGHPQLSEHPISVPEHWVSTPIYWRE